MMIESVFAVIRIQYEAHQLVGPSETQRVRLKMAAETTCDLFEVPSMQSVPGCLLYTVYVPQYQYIMWVPVLELKVALYEMN